MTTTPTPASQPATDMLPCPFCGGVAHATKGFTTSGDWPHGDFHRIFCGSCQNRQLFHRTKADAIAAWNRRAELAESAPSGESIDKDERFQTLVGA